jgi:hypothetical protein
MKKIPILIAALSVFAATGAQATRYDISSTSTLTDVARIGGRNIPEISTFTGCGAPCTGSLDPTDPLNWGIMDSDLTTHPVYVSGVATSGVEPNSANVSGSVEVVIGSVTAATLTMSNSRLSLTAFQSGTVQNNMVSGDSTVLQTLAEQGTVGVPLNPLTWTYDPVTGTLPHQGQVPGGGGNNGNSNNSTACVVLPGSTGPAGQCRQLAGAVNAAGVFGQFTTNNSVWNWTGIAANYTVRDNATTPWHTGTGATLTVTGAAGLPGVVWDLSGFVEGVGGTIKARVHADALGGSSGSAITALYTLTAQIVPVPDQIQDLIDDVAELGLPRGLANALTGKLQAALNKLNDGNPNNDVAAANKLNEFIDQVAAQSGKKIDAEDADVLIATAHLIISQL